MAGTPSETAGVPGSRVIVGIAPVARGDPRRRVNLAGGGERVLPREVVQALGLAPGRALPPEVDIMAADAAAARLRAVRLLAARPRTQAELRRRLTAAGHGAAAADAAVAGMARLGYASDETYARDYVEGRLRTRPVGAARLRAELQQRGVGRETAERAVAAALGDEDEAGLALRAAEAAAGTYRRLPPDVARRRLAAFLVRRGFAAEDVQAAVDRVLRPAGSGREAAKA